MKEKKLSKKLKREWIKALRSGEYKQCEGRLRKDDGFCCLGVLLDINEDVYWEKEEDWDCWKAKINDEYYDNYYGMNIISLHNVESLSEMNDDEKSFNDIADWIEENL